MIAPTTLPDVAAQIETAVTRARSAQRAWAATPVRERLKVIRGFQQALYRDVDAVAALIAEETGKPKAEALTAEVLVTLDATRFLLKEVSRLFRRERVPHGNLAMRAKRAYLHRAPHGVIGIISP